MERAVLEPEELPQVVAPRGALVRLGRGHQSAFAFGAFGEAQVLVSDALPPRRPVTPVRRGGEHPLEVVHVDPIRYEPRLPVRGRELDATLRLDGHRSPRSSRSATAER